MILNNFQRIVLISGDGVIPYETLAKDQVEINDLYISSSNLINSLLPNEEFKSTTDISAECVITYHTLIISLIINNLPYFQNVYW